MPFGVLREYLSRIVDRRVIFYAGENVEQFAVLLVGVICSVARKDRQVQLVSEADELLIHIFLTSEVMPLQLDVETLLKNIIQPCKVALPFAAFHARVHEASLSAGET